MKRSIFFVMAALVMCAAVWGNPIRALRGDIGPGAAENLPVEEITLNAAVDAAAARSLAVDGDTLMDHVSSIAYPRYQPEEKPPIQTYILEELATVQVDAQSQPYVHPGTGETTTGGVNIVATIPGSNPAAGAIVLGAHYDSVSESPGANDNGSGVATLLEAARLLSASAQVEAFPRTLKLVFFDQEERQPGGGGLLGSLAYVQGATDIDEIKAAVVLDMLGYACRTPGCQQYPARLPMTDLPETGEFIAVVGLNRHPALIDVFMESARRSLPTVMSLPIPARLLTFVPDLLRSDHAPFWEAGIPAVLVTDTANFRNPYYHTPQDTPENIDREFFAGSAQHVVNAIATLLSGAAASTRP